MATNTFQTNPNMTSSYDPKSTALTFNFPNQGSNIPVNAITPIQPLEIQNTIQAPIDNGSGLVTGADAGATQFQTDYQKYLDMNATPQNSQMDSLIQSLGINPQEGKGADQLSAEQQVGIPDFNKQIADIAGQIKTKTAAYNLLNANLEKGTQGVGNTDIRASMLFGQQGAVNRAAASEIGLLQAQQMALQGNASAAQTAVNRAIDLKYADKQAEYDTKLKQYELIKDKLSGEEAKRGKALEYALKKEETALANQKQTAKDNASLGQDYAKIAMEGGQSDIASQISALDPSSLTYRNDLAKLQSKITNPIAKLDIAIKQAELDYKRKQTMMLGESTPADVKKEKLALQTSSGQVDTLKEKVSLIDSILESGGMQSRVGTGILSRTPRGILGTVGKIATGLGIVELPFDLKAKLTGEGQQFSGGVHKLASREFLDALIGAKQQGATFGALTDREGDALRAAATQLNDWEIKDGKGMPTGVWNIDEASFKKELNNLKRLANLGIQRSGGTVFQQDEQSLLDNAFSTDNMALDPANYY